MEIIIAILAALWILSYFKFRRNLKRDRMLCALLAEKYREAPGPLTESEYACALMQCQQYASALKLLRI